MVIQLGKMYPRIHFAWAYEICKFVNYSITKYVNFNQLTTNKNTHLISVKLSFMETVPEIVLCIVQEFL